MWFYPACRAPLLMGINGKSLEFMFLFILNALSPQTLKPQSLLGTRSSVVFFLPPEIPIHSHFLCLLPLQLLLHPLLFHFSARRPVPARLHLTFTRVSCWTFLCLVTLLFFLSSAPVSSGWDTGHRRTSSPIGPTGVFGWPSWGTATQ